MTPIVAPLQLDDRKPEVANLQEGLLLLIDRQLLTIPQDQSVRTISELTCGAEKRGQAELAQAGFQ